MSVAGSYRPPPRKCWHETSPEQVPPHTIIRLRAQTAECRYRASGVFAVEVGVHVSVAGSYRPPVPVWPGEAPSYPPHTIIRFPVQTAVWSWRAAGALALAVGVQVSVAGLYRPPVFKTVAVDPPHTIIRLPVQTAEWCKRPVGAFAVEVGVQ